MRHRLRLLAFPMRTTPLHCVIELEISRFPCKERPYMPGSQTTQGQMGTRDVAPTCVAFRHTYGVSTPGVSLTRLDGRPARSHADASPAPSRVMAHGLGSMRITNPSSWRTLTTCSLAVSGRPKSLKYWRTDASATRHLPAGARFGCGILASMVTFRTRGRRWWLAPIAVALVASLAALLLRPMLEHAVRARIESATMRHGVVAQIGLVHVGVWPLLRLDGFDLDLGHGVRLHADMIAATWLGRLRLAVSAATLVGPAGVTASSPATAWDMAGILGEDLQLTLVEPQAGLSIRKLAGPVGSAWNVEAHGLNIGRVFDVQRDGYPLLN